MLYLSRLCRPFGVSFLALTFASACSPTTCNDMGCREGVSLVLHSEDGSLPDGKYEIALKVDGESYSCSFDAPSDLPTNGEFQEIECEGGISLAIEQAHTCTETSDGDSVSQSCTPIPGSFQLSPAIPGSPEQIEVRVQHDEVTLIESSETVQYEEHYINDAECGPPCRFATIELTW